MSPSHFCLGSVFLFEAVREDGLVLVDGVGGATAIRMWTSSTTSSNTSMAAVLLFPRGYPASPLVS